MVLNFWHRIKQFFSSERYFEVENFSWSNFDLVFTEISSEIAIQVAAYIKQHQTKLTEEPVKNKSTNQKLITSIDKLIEEIRRLIAIDSKEHADDEGANYTFKYFVDHNFDHPESIKICNVLSGLDGSTGNVIYKVLEIYKQKDKYKIVNYIEE